MMSSSRPGRKSLCDPLPYPFIKPKRQHKLRLLEIDDGKLPIREIEQNWRDIDKEICLRSPWKIPSQTSRRVLSNMPLRENPLPNPAKLSAGQTDRTNVVLPFHASNRSLPICSRATTPTPSSPSAIRIGVRHTGTTSPQRIRLNRWRPISNIMPHSIPLLKRIHMPPPRRRERWRKIANHLMVFRSSIHLLLGNNREA